MGRSMRFCRVWLSILGCQFSYRTAHSFASLFGLCTARRHSDQTLSVVEGGVESRPERRSRGICCSPHQLVIPTGAQRSGGTCCFRTARHSDRSAAEWRNLLSRKLKLPSRSPLRAEWRDRYSCTNSSFRPERSEVEEPAVLGYDETITFQTLHFISSFRPKWRNLLCVAAPTLVIPNPLGRPVL
jgi:hypothetical protein